LAVFQSQLFQDRLAEGIGEFLVTRDGGRESGEGVEIDVVLGA
jgi:hypothetical protein